jgi:hypothetical protein
MADLFVTDQPESSSLYQVGNLMEFQFSKVVAVNVTTLDAYFASSKSILLIKLDAQGSELSILRGGINTIQNARLILTEVLNADLYEEGCSYYQVDEFLRNSNYRIHSIFCDYNHQGSKYWDVLYLNNLFDEGSA